MSKLTITMVVMVLIIIGISIYTLNLFGNQAQNLHDIFNDIKVNIRNEEWDPAQKNIETLQKRWSEIQPIWTPFLDHTELENLSNTITRLSILIGEEERSDALTELSVADRVLSNIIDKEKPIIQNIF